MQMAVIEFARHVAGLEGANSAEFGEHKYDVIDIMPDQKGVDMGGTMRLGLYPCKLDETSISRELYGEGLIYERHRHRYEFNNTYREQMASKGLKFAGLSPDGKLVEIVELPKDVHPWFVAVQSFHGSNSTQEFWRRHSTRILLCLKGSASCRYSVPTLTNSS